MTTPMTRKLGKICPPQGMLPPPCPDEKFTSADKKKIMAEFKGLIPQRKLEAALDMVKSNHAEAARQANWVLSSVRDNEFLGARPRRGKKRKTRKKGQKRGGAPEWVKNRVTTLIIMLAIGGGFWALWPMLEGILVTYGLLPGLCGTGFAEHLGVMFGSFMSHGAVLTCLGRERQYREVIGGIIIALSTGGFLTRPRVADNYAEVHTYVRNALFGPEGMLASHQTPRVSASRVSQPSMSANSTATHQPSYGHRRNEMDEDVYRPTALPSYLQRQRPPNPNPATGEPYVAAPVSNIADVEAVSEAEAAPEAVPEAEAAPAAEEEAEEEAAPQAEEEAAPQGSQGGTRKKRKSKSKRGARSRKHPRNRKTYRRLRKRKHRN